MAVSQQIFKHSYVRQLYQDIKFGRSLEMYFENEFSAEPQHLLDTDIVLPDEAPKLESAPEDDTASAIAVYEYLGQLNSSQASDPRLWVYLSHVTFREYTMQRWKITKEMEKSKAVDSIITHWFVTENDRKLRRHALARLWWAAKLTVSPWESDPTNFIALKNDDKYIYTRLLLSRQDIFLNTLERGIGRSQRILIALLETLRQKPEIAADRDEVRNLIKNANLVSGYKKLAFLPFEEVYKITSAAG